MPQEQKFHHTSTFGDSLLVFIAQSQLATLEEAGYSAHENIFNLLEVLRIPLGKPTAKDIDLGVEILVRNLRQAYAAMQVMIQTKACIFL